MVNKNIPVPPQTQQNGGQSEEFIDKGIHTMMNEEFFEKIEKANEEKQNANKAKAFVPRVGMMEMLHEDDQKYLISKYKIISDKFKDISLNTGNTRVKDMSDAQRANLCDAFGVPCVNYIFELENIEKEPNSNRRLNEHSRTAEYFKVSPADNKSEEDDEKGNISGLGLGLAIAKGAFITGVGLYAGYTVTELAVNGITKLVTGGKGKSEAGVTTNSCIGNLCC